MLLNLLKEYPHERLHLMVDRGWLQSVLGRRDVVPWTSETVHPPDWRRLRAFGRRVVRGRPEQSEIDDVSRHHPPDPPAATRDALSRLGWHVSTITEFAWVPIIAFRAILAMRRSRLDAIFTVQGAPAYVVGAYLASLISRVPLFFFSLDAWADNGLYRSALREWVARTFEPRVLRHSAARWSISPFQAGEWQARYGITSDICWHSVEVADFEQADTPHRPPAPVVVVLGTIYAVNSEEFRRLCRAVGRLREGPMPDLSVRLYTTQDAEQLETEGVPRLPWVTSAPLTPEEVPSALAGAAVLFLGLSFEERWRRVDQVAFPTKLAEYLAAGRPIVVNAPSYATAASYTLEHSSGLVVDAPDDDALVSALEKVLADRPFAARLGMRGRAVAKANHDRSAMVGRFLGRIEECSTRRQEDGSNPGVPGGE